MKRIILITTILIFLSVQAYCKNSFYVSPGITLGWNIGNGFTFTPKFSLGIVNSYREFYNITYGYNFHTSKNDSKFDYNDYHLFELQAGSLLYCVGGGVGLAVFDNKHSVQIAPKATLFAGYGLYVNMDLIILENKLNTNLGIQAVLPICPSGVDFVIIGRY